MPRGNGYVNVPIEKVKSRIESRLKNGERLCKGWSCYRTIKIKEEYCDSCKLTYDPKTYAKSCLVCPKQILKTSNSSYCSFHNKTCLGCSTRIASNHTCCSYHEKCLDKLRQYKSISNIQKLETFETWFNGNCGYVINYDCLSSSNYPYCIWIVVYEPAIRSINENLFAIKHDNWPSLSSAKSKAVEIRDKLKYSDNPILYVHPQVNSYERFHNIITSPYVKRIDNMPSWTNEPDRYLKPLDIVKTNMAIFDHVGVYLGKIDGEIKVCHFTRENNDTTIDSWSDFVEGGVRGYHPVIPFKNYKDIIGQAVWAKDNNFRKGRYDLHRRNCEHLANMLVYGINFSEQIDQNKSNFTTGGVATATASAAVIGGGSFFNIIGSIALAPATGGASLLLGAASAGLAIAGGAVARELVNNIDDDNANDGKKSINLGNEIKNADNLLGWKSDYETEKYERQYLQEVPPKENCRII